MLTVTITCLSFLNNLVTMQLSGWPGLSVGLREGSSGSGAFWRVRIPQVWVAEGELPVGVGGVSSGPTITTAPVIITPPKAPAPQQPPPPRHGHPALGTPPLYPSWTEHAVGGGMRISKVPPDGAARLRARVGGVTPPLTPGPISCPRHC